jgi:hypothetical protein
LTTTVGSGVTVGVLVGVSVGVAVDDGVSVEVAVGVAVQVSVGVAVGVSVGVAVGVFVGVAVGVLIDVAVGVAVGVSVGVAVGVSVGDAVSVGVSVGVAVAVAVPVEVFVGDCVGVGVGVAVAVDVGDGLGVVVGVALALGVSVRTTVGVAACVASAVGVCEAVGGGVPAHGVYPRKRAEIRFFPASVKAITRTVAKLAMRYRVLFPCPAAMSHTGTTMSSIVRRAKAARTALLLDAPGLPCTQSPTESRSSSRFSGSTYVVLSPGGVRLRASVGALGSPVHVSQPKFPGCDPFKMSRRTSPTFAHVTEVVCSAIGKRRQVPSIGDALAGTAPTPFRREAS